MAAILLLILAVVTAAVAYLFYFKTIRFNPESLRGKRVLLTGASSGIGEQVAYEYAKCGTRLVLAARRESKLIDVVRRCLELGAEQADYIICDLRNQLDRKRLVEETERLLGGIDYLVMDHALFFFEFWNGSEDNMTEFQQLLNVNTVAYVDIASKCLPMLIKSHGAIGVVSSIDGKIPLCKCSTHSTSKFALQGFFLSWRKELELHNVPVTVTLIIMGATGTIFDHKSYSMFGMYANTVEESAMAILKGVTSRENEVYTSLQTKIAVWFHKFFPRTIETYLFSCSMSVLELEQQTIN